MAFHPLILAGSLLPLVAAWPVSVAQQVAPVAADMDVIDLRRDATDRMTVPVRIGTAGPFAFLVDTGAERTVLARDVATRLGLAASGTATLVGVAGSQAVDLVEVEEINLGTRSFYGLSAPLLEGRFIGADGIIGLDSLQGQRVLLDFDRNRMAIGDAAALGGSRGFEIVVQARRRSGQLIMANALIDGVHTEIVIDTGSDASIGNRALQKALVRRHQQEKTELLSVTGQTITADLGLARKLELGGLTMTNTMIVFADAPPFERLSMTRRPAMLLGMNQLRLFHRVAIDFGARRILFDLPKGAAPPRS
ncbi:retroviral-like aspartic protease family protein [Novosphingobium sp. KCTC 2891]|uniref:retroviral-like aspartic protease family protein n=1 Tax=Novosphingobium sp. KCTC 2891 TaxID=2989730 RepID=UPI002222FD6A|nr:retroviral-like aspartic protease family protein [Novosphingobium sp. KCTC 2891]MCW1384050.1 retroviral-like aspartic protease family protein [Novosphingobium sp. KCTC 2891]